MDHEAIMARKKIADRYIQAAHRPVEEQLARTPTDPTGFIKRHERAMTVPRSFERSLRALIDGLMSYAVDHEARYGSKLGEDGVLGEAWADALRGVRGLLNGELGDLDGGLLDGALCNLYREAGFEGEL